MSAASAALLLFASCNAMRILAYVLQISRITRDQHGAGTVCYSTWALVTASNLSAVFYAVAVVSDWLMAIVFTINAACCVAIVALTRMKRLLKGASHVVRPSEYQKPILRSGYTPVAQATDPTGNRVGVG
jgi:hypothetical protein